MDAQHRTHIASQIATTRLATKKKKKKNCAQKKKKKKLCIPHRCSEIECRILLIRIDHKVAVLDVDCRCAHARLTTKELGQRATFTWMDALKQQ